MLPAPSSERWKPLRAGLVDMFYYDHEEFWFHDGRLLLRGNNGTGKSKVLALTLPFLLDGDLAPHRVEPDGDRQKRMEWNLLLGGRHPSPERLGYTWLEFGRRGADGTEEFRTIGCGLKAVTGRGIARHWFFVTSQRPGNELQLLPGSRVPLTREKLREEIGQHGFVYDRAADYRRAVDEHLFGLGPHRYEALVNLLVQLRQPQLSKKPDEKLLSRALTEALPPLSPGLVTTVAEAFRGLDEERDALRSLAEAQEAATAFLGHYRRYAKVAAKRKAAGPRLTQSRYEGLGRDLATAEDAFTAAQQQLDEAQRELTQLEEQRTELEARQGALQADPAMRDAERLEHLRQDADRKEKAAQVQEADRDRHAGQVRRYAEKAAQTAHRAGTGRDKLAEALREAATTAADAGCAQQHQASVAALDGPNRGGGLDTFPPGDQVGGGHRAVAAYLEAPEAPAVDILARARRDAQAIADRQGRAIAQLERLLADVAGARGQLHAAQEAENRRSAEVHAAADRVTTADLAVEERMRLILDAYRSYLSGLAELRVADPDELIATLESWGLTGEGTNPAAAIIDDAVRVTGAELGQLAGELGSQRTRHVTRAGELTEQIGRLRAGGHDAPPVPPTREPGVRDGRPGAPLWRVTDFAPGLADDERAGVEAALEAAGILDAWVTPDGNLVDGDVVVASGLASVAGESCASLLVPAIDRADPQAAALDEVSVASVLSAIGREPGTADGGAAWVTTDGRWSNGLLRVAVTSQEIPDVERPWAATPTVVLARAVNAELDSVDDADGPWDRIQKRVTEEHKLLADAMARHGHSAALTLSEGVIVIDVLFQGRSHDLPGLAEALAAEVEQRTTLLSAREREILENHLLNEVAGTLHELISGAEAEVRQMNDELESRPTSTGMKLRLIWQQARNAPEGLDRVRLKLRQTIDAWSAADRALVGTFLQQRIAAEHADNPATGWAEALTSALDYRGWHEFVIQRYQDGHWRPATGPASGGERALVVSVPLFAAASSHYKSAGNPHAPRLIALDEAFAGVDDDSRAKCLGLLATFDMDVVMTSEREWGCYPQVPGLGISHLARQDGVDAVLVTPWRWDGRQRRRADRAAV